jgi:hypothetical protein
MIRFVPRSFFSLVTLQIGNGEIGFVQKKYFTSKSNYNFSPTELILVLKEGSSVWLKV